MSNYHQKRKWLASVAMRLGALREASGLTRLELAQKIADRPHQRAAGVPFWLVRIADFENGIGEPNIGQLYDIADALNVRIADIIGDER